MNKVKYMFAVAFVGLVIFGSGCKKFVDVNQDPNNNTNPRVDLIFTGAEVATYRNQVNPFMHIVPSHWTGIMSFSSGVTGGGQEKTYNYTNADFNIFGTLYNNLSDYNYIIQNAASQNFGYLKDPADVMSCYVYQQLVDLYGDVPYSDAFKGTQGVTPKYDNQQAVYENLVVRLDSAMDRITRTTWPTSLDNTQQDVIFQLNKTLWLQFANTVKLKILMRQSYMPGRDTYIKAAAVTRLANGFMTQNVLVNPPYQLVAGKLNPFYANYGYNEINSPTQNFDFRKMNTVILSFLKAPSGGPADTFRLQSIAYPQGTSANFSTPTGSTTSITNGTATVAQYNGTQLGTQAAPANMSPIGPIQIQVPAATRPGMMMVAAESYFLQAEFVQRYGIALSSANPQTLFESGITASFRTCAAPSTAGNVANAGDAFATRYFNRPLNYVNYVASTNKVSAILVQKWVALTHIDGLNQWSDYRKSNQESIPSSLVPLVHSSVVSDPREPVRYLYPQSELDNNGSNVPTNIDRFTSKIFWDVN